jgi:hypothetical protein
MDMNLDNIESIKAWRKRGNGTGSAGTYQVIDWLIAEHDKAADVMAVAERAIQAARSGGIKTMDDFHSMIAQRNEIFFDLVAAAKVVKSKRAVETMKGKHNAQRD